MINTIPRVGKREVAICFFDWSLWKNRPQAQMNSSVLEEILNRCHSTVSLNFKQSLQRWYKDSNL